MGRSMRSKQSKSLVRVRFEAVRVAAILLLVSVPCWGLAAFPVRLRRTGTGTSAAVRQRGSRSWSLRRKAAVPRASTPPHGDYDYAYDNSNDGSNHGYYQQQQQQQQQQQGQEMDFTTGTQQQGYAAAAAAPAGAVAAPVANNVQLTGVAQAATPAQDFGDGGAWTGSLTKEIQGRTISVGQLFGKTTRAVIASAQQKKAGLMESKSHPPGLLWRAGVKSMVPVAAAVGLSLTPSRYIAARAAGGVVLAIAANVARQAAVATRKKLAPEAMLELLRREGASSVTREQLVDLAEKYFVKEPALWESARFLYSSILADTVANHRPNNEDLDDLVMLKWTLELSSQEVASCHQKVIADAVSSVGAPVSMDKMVYLSERMFFQEGTTDAGYLDQCARLRNQLGGMTQVDLLRKVTQYAAPYYEMVLEDVISRPENFSAEALLRTRRRLGVSEVVAGGMHLDIYQSAIQRLLDDNNGKLEEGDRLWLSRLRGTMSISQFEGERALESVTAPIYREVVQAAFVEAAGLHWGQPGVDALRSKLRSRQGDLQLSIAAADAVVKETIRKLALRSLEVALISLRSGGGESSKAEVLRSMAEVFRLKDAAALIVQKTPNADCSRYFVGVLVGSPSLRLAESEKRSIFRMHLENALKDMRLDEEDKATLAELRSMLQLVEADTRQVYISVINPLLSSRLAGMLEHGDFTAQDITKLEEDLTVPHEAFLDTCMEAYHTKLTKLLERGDITDGASSMPSDIEKAALDSAAEALGLSREQLYTIHDITCGPAFRAAALDLLTAAEDEAGQGFGEPSEPVIMVLETLRIRLGMSNDGARAAFVGAFFEVAAPKVKKVSTDIEALKDARKVVPTTMAMSSPPLPVGSSSSALAVARGPSGGDGSIVSRALLPPGGGGVAAGRGVAEAAAAAAEEGRNGDALSYVEKLELRAEEIMERVLGLAAFCERAGASKELDAVLTASSTGRSDPLYSADMNKAVGPRPALLVYTFFLEEGFSPARDSFTADDHIVQKRDSLALVLGLSKARVIDVHRGAASRLYLDFVQGKLQQRWTLDADDSVSLKTMEEALGMTGVVCEELLTRGKKSFVRRRVEEAGARAMDDPIQARRLRQCAENLGISLRDDLALPEERRRRMFEAEAKVVLSEERDAAIAKSSLERTCSSLGLPDGAVYDLYSKLRNAPGMEQQNSGLDGTVIVVNGGRSADGQIGGSSAGFQAGEGGRGQQPHMQQHLASFGGGCKAAFSTSAGNFIFQTRAGTRQKGPEVRPGHGRSVPGTISLVMSGGGMGSRKMNRGVGASGGGGGLGGDGSVIDSGGGYGGGGVDKDSDGFIVGAEGAFPVKIGFGVRDEWIEDDEVAEEVVQDEFSSGTSGSGPEGKVRDGTETPASPGGRRGREGGDGKADDKVSGLESWAADFGLFVSEDEGGLEGTGGAEPNDLAGWGAFEPDARMALGTRKEEEEEGGEGGGQVEGPGKGVNFGRIAVVGAGETGPISRDVPKEVAVEREEAVSKTPVKDNVGTEDKGESDVAAKYPVDGVVVRPAAGRTTAAIGGDVGLDPPGAAPRTPGKSKRDSSGFFARLVDLAGNGGDRESVNLEMAARAAGGELYGLTDRLSALSAVLAQRPLAAAGEGAASAAAAATEVTSLRSILKTGEFRSSFGRPGEVRQATKAAERRVRRAEREVEKDIAILDDAESRQAAALAGIAACRGKLDASRKSLGDADTLDSNTLPVLLGALGKVQASVDACADRLEKSSAAPLQRGRAASATAEELALATCKAKVEAVVVKVDEACSREQDEKVHHESRARDETSRRSGDRWLMQARALRRAMLGPEGVGRRRSAGVRFEEALDKLDAALAEADRLRVDAGAHRSPTEGQEGGAAFAKAARKASLAAEALQNAGEVVFDQEVKRAEGARALVSMALGDVAAIEADANDAGFAGDRDISEGIRVARKRLEKMSRALQEESGEGATLRDKSRVEALVASGKLESALQGVDAARAVLSRVRRVAAAETEARDILATEKTYADDLSRRAQEVGLFERPAVVRAVQACRTAGLAADRFYSRGRQMSLAQREALAKEYMSAVLFAREETARTKETLARETEAAAINDEVKCRLKESLQAPKAAVAVLQGRLDRFAISAEQRRTSLEGVRELALSWEFGLGSSELRGSVPPESYGQAASRATTEARKNMDTIVKGVEASRDVAALDDDVKRSQQLVSLAQATAAQIEVRGRRRSDAISVLERAAARTETVIADAGTAKVTGRSAMVASLADAVQKIRDAVVRAASSAEIPGPGEVEADDAFVAAAGQAEQAAEAAAESLARERVLVEQMEERRQELSVELWSAARRLEGLDTGSVVGDDPEAAAMVLEARSEAMQVLVTLEAAEDPSGLLFSRAQTALEKAFGAEENFVESQRKVRCFDDATCLLEQAEVLVGEAQTTMRARSVPAASRASFQEALERYEGVLSVAATSSDGADAFFEACTAAFSAARGVDRAAVRASRRVHAHKERLRRELARLDRPAAALVALDLSELTEARGEASFRAVAEGVRDALSTISSVREEVAKGSGGRGEAEEAALADRVDNAVHAAASAERAFREARDRVRRMERGWQQLANPEAVLARTQEEIRVLPDTRVVSELCAASMQRAGESLAAARASVAAIGKDGNTSRDVEAVIKDASVKVKTAQRDAEEQTTRVKSAASQRQMLRSSLTTSDDSIAQAQAGLEAEQHGQPYGDSDLNGGGKNGDTMFEALRACALAERAVAAARENLERPLTAEWFRAAPDQRTAGEEERLVEAAQVAATDAEQATARLVERLGQIRGIRAKLRSLLAQSEARFRKASADLADAGVADVEEVHVASTALALARDRLRTSLGSGYLAPDGGGGASGGGSGSLARDEEAVSEAAGFVEALALLASRAATSTLRAERSGTLASKAGSEKPENEALDALALALQWGDALRVRVSELKLESDPAVAQAVEATEEAALTAESLWPPGGERSDGGGSGMEGRAAVEGLAAQLGELESVTERAAEKRRAHEAGLGAAARRFDRLTATFRSLRETVHSAGEPLLVSLTAAAINTAQDAIAAASAAGSDGPTAGLGDIGTAGDTRESAFTDAVQAAAVAVAQAEATVTHARERAPQVSAERVRTLETLVGLAETLSEAGEKLASSSVGRGLSSSREAAAAILEAQAGLSKARKAAQVDGGAWGSGIVAIAEAVADAGELVRRAKRAADIPTSVRPASRTGPAMAGRATEEDVGAAEASARAWLAAEGEAKGRGKEETAKRRRRFSSVDDDVDGNEKTKPPKTLKARIGFSKKGGGDQTYLPLWMRLQKKVWEAGGSGRDRLGNVVSEQQGESAESLARSADPAAATQYPDTGRSRQREMPKPPPPSGTTEKGSPKAAVEKEATTGGGRRSERERLRAEANRLRAEAARLRARRAGTPAKGVFSAGVSGSGNAKEPRNFKQAAETLAEEMVKEFATRAKKEAQQRESRTGDSGED